LLLAQHRDEVGGAGIEALLHEQRRDRSAMVSLVESFISDYRLGVPAGLVAETVTSSLSGKYAATIATFRGQ
jgi:hypothetical protein